jgi:L-ribulose-5-phosphate 3-epimerase/hexulose-6-phosphate isomerase
MDLRENLIGIYEKAIPNQFNWEEKIKIALAAGFDFIEISIDESDYRLGRLDWTKKEKQNLLSLLKKNDFFIKSMCLSGHRRFPFGSSDEFKRKKAYEIIDKAIDFAIDLKIENIQLAGYDVYYEDSTEESLRLFIEGLKYSAKKAEAKGVMLSLEIMDTYLIGTIQRAMNFTKTIASPNLKIYPDLGNLSRWSSNPSEELRIGFDQIEAIHLKDTLPGIFKEVPFGRGTVDFVSLFNTLKELKYDKPFLIEMWAKNDKLYTEEESIEELKAAKNWLFERM